MVTIDQALSEHIVQAINNLNNANVPLIGKRKIVQFLQGKNSKFSIKYDLHLLPAWGSISFISVKKLESILKGMIDVGILVTLESPRIGKPVITISNDSASGLFSLAEVFPPPTGANLTPLQKDIFEKLRKARTQLAKQLRIYIRKMPTDQTLVDIARINPNEYGDILALKERILEFPKVGARHIKPGIFHGLRPDNYEICIAFSEIIWDGRE